MVIDDMHDQKKHRQRMEKWAAQRAAIAEASAAGKLVGLELLASSEAQPFKRWMRGKVLRSLFVEVGGQTYAPAWMVMLWRERHRFADSWRDLLGDNIIRDSKLTEQAFNALRRLVARAARSPDLAEYLDTCVRLAGAKGLVAPAREAMQKRA